MRLEICPPWRITCSRGRFTTFRRRRVGTGRRSDCCLRAGALRGASNSPLACLSMDSMTAYLVIREGSKWTDVFRLVDGESVTIGRAPTNAIVVKDERCSRNHAEVFQAQSQWTLRDLDSRNGTLVDGQRIQSDYQLQAGDIVRIGNSHLAFVHDLSQAFPDSHSVLRTAQAVEVEDNGDPTVGTVGQTKACSKPTSRRRSPIAACKAVFWNRPEEEDVDISLPKVGRAAANLCRLAFELAKATDVITLANVALDGLFEGTQVDAGAVLLQARRPTAKQQMDSLEVVASRSDSPHRYHRVSQFLSSTVMRDGQAVLARNVMDDSQLGSRDSKGDILATSVICAPIRREGKVLGVIHLYSHGSVARRPTPMIWSSRWPWPTRWPWPWKISAGSRSWPKTSIKSAAKTCSFASGWACESEIVGDSELMKQVEREIARAAPSRATVLIRGESGVGKELVARAVHYSSPRQEGAVRVPELRRTLRNAAGERAVRPRERRIHRRHGAEDRQIRGGRQGHAHARRNRRDERQDAGQVPARAGRASVRARRRQRGDQGRRARDRRHQPRPGKRRRRGHVPPRLVFPVARAGDRRARAAQAAGRHSASWPSIFCSVSSQRRAARSKASRRGRWKKCCATAGPATCAS